VIDPTLLYMPSGTSQIGGLLSYMFFSEMPLSVAAASLRSIIHPKFSFMVDSGVFTARKKGQVIDLDAYGTWVAEGDASIFGAITIDWPNTFEATVKNTKKLSQYSKKIMPVCAFYMTDKQIDFLCGEYSYCAIGGGGLIHRGKKVIPMTNSRGDYLRRLHMQRVFFYAEKHGTRIHGLGIGDPAYLCDFPFASIDNSILNNVSHYGKYKVCVPGTFKTRNRGTLRFIGSKKSTTLRGDPNRSFSRVSYAVRESFISLFVSADAARCLSGFTATPFTYCYVIGSPGLGCLDAQTGLVCRVDQYKAGQRRFFVEGFLDGSKYVQDAINNGTPIQVKTV